MAPSHSLKKRLSIRQSVRTFFCQFLHICQRGFYWTDFHEIWLLRILRKSAEKSQIWLTSNKNVGHFTWIPSVFHTFGSDNCSAATEISLLCFLCNASNVSEIPESDISYSLIQGKYNRLFPWQLWLRESPTVIRNTYIAYLDKFRGVNTGRQQCASICYDQ